MTLWGPKIYPKPQITGLIDWKTPIWSPESGLGRPNRTQFGVAFAKINKKKGEKSG